MIKNKHIYIIIIYKILYNKNIMIKVLKLAILQRKKTTFKVFTNIYNLCYLILRNFKKFKC